MSIMIKDKTNNSSLVEDLQTTLPQIPSKTPPLPPPLVPTPVPMIAATNLGTLAANFLAISMKVQLNIILNRKRESPIYHSDATSLEGIYNALDIPNEHISALFAALSNSSDAPLDEPNSEFDSHANMIVLGNHFFVFEWSGKSCTVNPFNDCLGYVKDVPIIDANISYDFPYSHECDILICQNALYLNNTEDNLLPPFIMRESGATVNDTPKIHCTDPTSNDH